MESFSQQSIAVINKLSREKNQGTIVRKIAIFLVVGRYCKLRGDLVYETKTPRSVESSSRFPRYYMSGRKHNLGTAAALLTFTL